MKSIIKIVPILFLIVIIAVLQKSSIEKKISEDFSLDFYLNTDINNALEQLEAAENQYYEEHYTIVERKTDEKPSLLLSAISAAVYDSDFERVLFEKSGFDKRAMASTTKIMTCIIALESGNPDMQITVSKYAASMPDVQLNMKAGDKFYLKDLLYSLMLESHNDTAVAIAEGIAGSVEAFAFLMNEKAKSLELADTSFVTPNGLDAEGHYSTAVDLCKLAAYAEQNSKFVEITNTVSYSFKEINSGKQYTVNNKNQFLGMYEGAIGVKTGFTGKAGYCFVGAVNKNDNIITSAVLGSGWPPNKNYKWSDTKKLMNFVFNNYRKIKINTGEYFKDSVKIPVFSSTKAVYNMTPPVFTREILFADWEEYSISCKIRKYILAPEEKDKVIGRISHYIDNRLVYSEDIILREAFEAPDYKFMINKILSEIYW